MSPALGNRTMNTNPKPTSFGRLQLLLLNFAERHEGTDFVKEADLTTFRTLVRTNGTRFNTKVGHDELQVLYGENFALLTLKRELNPIAKAYMAADPCTAALLWNEMLGMRMDMLEALGRSASTLLHQIPPSSVPWLGVSLHQRHVATLPGDEIHAILSTLCAMALAILQENPKTRNPETQ